MKIVLLVLVLTSSIFAQSADREKISENRMKMMQEKEVFMIAAMTKDLNISSCLLYTSPSPRDPT